MKKSYLSENKDLQSSNSSSDSRSQPNPKRPAAQKSHSSPETEAVRREREEARLVRRQQKRDRQKARKQSKASQGTEPISSKDSRDKRGSQNLGAAEGTRVDDNHLKPTSDIRHNIQNRSALTASPSPEAPSSTFDAPQNISTHSGSSSISSIQPATEILSPDPPIKSQVESARTSSNLSSQDHPIKSKPSAAELRERLAARIEALRAARNADGPNGQPARSRQELLESRRKKEEERRAHKKELRRQAKEEEARKRDEEMAQRFSRGGSGSLLASPMSPLPSDVGSNNFTFGHVAFGDGSQTSDVAPKKNKGPSDPATALRAAQAKQNRVSAFDAEKRANVEEKDMWANANKRARGEKLRDNASLLKKALKRKESQKGKSAKEWQDRTEGVQKAKEGKQRKREENLHRRREEKGFRKGKKSGQGSNSKSTKTAKRPGFEGSFRARSRGGGLGKK